MNGSPPTWEFGCISVLAQHIAPTPRNFLNQTRGSRHYDELLLARIAHRYTYTTVVWYNQTTCLSANEVVSAMSKVLKQVS